MNTYDCFQFGDVWWRARRDVASALFDQSGLRLADWLRSGQASIVKHGPHRTVYRVELGQRRVYIKHYRVADARAMISQWAQASKGRREWDRVNEVARNAIPTTVPLALGEQRKAGFVFENFLVTEAIENVHALDAFVEHRLPLLPDSRQESLRRHLARGLAQLVARLHQAGVLHPDLHAGNVLVRAKDDDELELYLIDLHAARSARHASWQRSRHNLLAFGLYFLTMAGPRDRLRFLRHYLEARLQLTLDWKHEAHALDRDLRRRARWHWHRLDERCITNNRRFLFRDIGAAHGHAAAEFGEAALLALLRDPDAPFQNPAAEVLKQSPSSSVVRLTMPVGGRRVPVIYKRFSCPKTMDPIRATLYRSPALRAWHAGHALLIRSIPTPRPLAIIERCRGPLVCESYLVTSAMPDAVNLRDYLGTVIERLAPGQRRQRVRWLMHQMGRLVRNMHERTMSHRDMKAANFLVAPADPNADTPELCLIDLAGVQNWRRLPERRRIQNVARIIASLQTYPAITRSDALRFLRAYLSTGLADRPRWKSLWRELERRIERKIAQNLKSKRSIT